MHPNGITCGMLGGSPWKRFLYPPLLRTMSSFNAGGVTTAANQDGHHIVAEEVAKDVTITLHQGAPGNSLRHILRGTWPLDAGFLILPIHATDGESKTDPGERQVVGHVPPAEAFATEVQSATDEAVESKDTADTKITDCGIDPQALKVAALEDTSCIQTGSLSIDLDKVGVKDARIIMSEEHKSLGYRPPPDSLAAKAQRSSTKHPDSELGLDATTLREAARADAERIK